MKPVHFDDEAVAEIAESAAWYGEQDARLVAQLLNEIEVLSAAIGQSPRRFPALQKPQRTPPLRRAKLRTFPYVVIFIELPTEVRALAFAHMRRRPLYWLKRTLKKA